MGIGDEIIASGHAKAEYLRSKKRVQVLDLYGRARWSDLWKGLDFIARPSEHGDFSAVKDGPQCRPYIRYPFNRDLGCRYSGWRCRDNVGEIALTEAEENYALKVTASIPSFILIEPYLLPDSNPNKQWGKAKWQVLADILISEGRTVCQVGSRMVLPLNGVLKIETPTFRHGAAVMRHATLSILPDGGLHHAAGAMGLPAIVLFGGSVDADAMGYENHINVQSGKACGNWRPCRHCSDIWAALEPHEIAEMVKRKLGGQRECEQAA